MDSSRGITEGADAYQINKHISKAEEKLEFLFKDDKIDHNRAYVSYRISGVLNAVKHINAVIGETSLTPDQKARLGKLEKKLSIIKKANEDRESYGLSLSGQDVQSCLDKLNGLLKVQNLQNKEPATAVATINMPTVEEQKKWSTIAGDIISKIQNREKFVNQEGIFRISGSEKSLKEKKTAFETNPKDTQLTDDVNVTASLIKHAYAKIRPFGSSDGVINAFRDIDRLKDDPAKIKAFKDLINNLSPDVRKSLNDLTKLLNEVHKNNELNQLNKMPASNLARMLAPNLCADETDVTKLMQDLKPNADKIQFMIENYEAIFPADEKPVEKDDLKEKTQPQQPVTVSPSNIPTGTVGASNKTDKESIIKEQSRELVNKLSHFIISIKQNEEVKDCWQKSSNDVINKNLEQKLLKNEDSEVNEIVAKTPGAIRDVFLSNLSGVSNDWPEVQTIKTTICKLLLSSDDILQSIAAVGKANPTLMKEILEGANLTNDMKEIFDGANLTNLTNSEIRKKFDKLAETDIEDVENGAEIQETIRVSLKNSYGSI